MVFDLKMLYEAANGKTVVLYGAGRMGELWKALLQWMGIPAVCFCDNDAAKQGTSYLEIPVLSYAQAIQKYPNAIYIATPYFDDTLKEQLRKDGRYQPAQDAIDAYKMEPICNRTPSYLEFYAYYRNSCAEDQTPFSPAQFTLDSVSKMVVVAPTGRSGSFYLASLLDGHSHVLTVPTFSESACLTEYEEHWQYTSGSELVMQVFSHCTRRTQSSSWLLNEAGQFREELEAPWKPLLWNLFKLLMPVRHINLGVIIKAIHCAYANAMQIPYHAAVDYQILMHFYSVHAHLIKQFLFRVRDGFDLVKCLLPVRRTTEQFYATQRAWRKDSPYYHEAFPQMIASWDANQYGELMLFRPSMRERDYGCETRFVRFEDLKRDPENTMRACCAFLQIPYEPCLVETTAGGMTVYADAGASQLVTGNYQGGVTRDYSFMLTPFDRFRFELLFSDLDWSFGYLKDGAYPSICSFSSAFLKELYTPPFLMEQVCFGDWPDFQQGFRENLWKLLRTLETEQITTKAPVLEPIADT